MWFCRVASLMRSQPPSYINYTAFGVHVASQEVQTRVKLSEAEDTRQAEQAVHSTVVGAK